MNNLTAPAPVIASIEQFQNEYVARKTANRKPREPHVLGASISFCTLPNGRTFAECFVTGKTYRGRSFSYRAQAFGVSIDECLSRFASSLV